PAATSSSASAYLTMSPADADPGCSTLLFTRLATLGWHARRDSNPQPAVLETAALPIELLAYGFVPFSGNGNGGLRRLARFRAGRRAWEPGVRFTAPPSRGPGAYLMIFDTTPAPTVRPPSRIANRRPSSIAIGLISVTDIFTLSPGITISTPSGSSTAPVMSVVRK